MHQIPDAVVELLGIIRDKGITNKNVPDGFTIKDVQTLEAQGYIISQLASCRKDFFKYKVTRDGLRILG